MEGSGHRVLQVTVGSFVLALTYRLVTLFPDRSFTLRPPELDGTLILCTANFDKQRIEGYTEPH